MSQLQTIESRIAELLQAAFTGIEIVTEWPSLDASDAEKRSYSLEKKLKNALGKLGFSIAITVERGQSEVQKSSLAELNFTVAFVRSSMDATNLPEAMERAWSALQGQWNGTGNQTRDEYKLWPQSFSVVPDVPGYEGINLEISTKTKI